MNFGRALGFLAGGAAQGYGQGIVEQSRLDWQKMLQEQSEARADARDTRRMEYDAVEKTKDRTLRSDELKDARAERDLNRLEANQRHKENLDATKDYRDGMAQDRDERRLMDKRREDAAAQKRGEEWSAGDERLWKIVIGRHTTKDPSNIEPDVINYAAAAEEFKKRGRADMADLALPATSAPAASTAAPAAQRATPTPPMPKPQEYPDAQWVDDGKTKGWVVKRDGKSFVVE